jgi:hypothetical protein
MADRHSGVCHKTNWGGYCNCNHGKKRTNLRTTFALREVLRIGKMKDSKDCYASKMIGRGRSYAIEMFDGVSGLEEMALQYLACKPGDKLEVFMSFRKVNGKKG